TVPTLMANYRKQEVSSRLKKFYSTLLNAVRLADMENPGFIKDGYSASRENYGQWWNDTIGKYLPITEKDNTSYKVFSNTYNSGWTPSKLYILNDGSMIFDCWHNSNITVQFYIDINGEKAPNYIGKDIFAFSIGDRHSSTDNSAIAKGIFVCSGWGYCGLKQSYNRDILLSNCASATGVACTKLLWLDGWEVKDDYPLL
ncbi:MAG: hypothetical protein LUG16_02195, partial [Candidatus Gastranaerophilales bacterium]|nr:hypothetical protein [Candidatus Gastranaerophilales bacterium]